MGQVEPIAAGSVVGGGELGIGARCGGSVSFGSGPPSPPVEEMARRGQRGSGAAAGSGGLAAGASSETDLCCMSPG